ncbi:MAG: carbon storage regulator CsrA [Ignavibacteriaceae bacterium]|jgi:carbon storage regulator|nr:carbon storage regulator CsrA [Ignavibacterium sp.]MCC6256011.1 carbon storage regulator CsrA [Ignavibacteriaceae bacterium]HMN22889.1 carbon storage regulator CsrA [Ignavibacteriaceae bacterium]HRN25653.1 carbon storage regulator CsrA [Ignavibacteriaceae bacterium]HRP91705.1 carbon storage regulator CsrA [Ignavibacteriaceae bacterium]
MLILTRKLNEEIKIGSGITVKIISISDNTVKIGIDAPQNIQIVRTELYDKVKESSVKAIKSVKEKPVDVTKLKIKKID